MKKTFYVVRSFINGHEGCRPSEFVSKDDALEFINELKRHSLNCKSIKCEYRLYEVKEIDI